MNAKRALSEPPPQSAGLFGVEFEPQTDEVIVIGAPWEPTASYGRGTSRTPGLIAKASHQLDFFDSGLGQAFGDQVGMPPINEAWTARNAYCMALVEPLRRSGGGRDPAFEPNLAEINAASAKMNEELRVEAAHWLERGKIVGVLGGDHSAPLGSMKAHAERFGNMGVLHIDAHHDLRRAYEGFVYSHASVMFNLLAETPGVSTLVSVGVRDFSQEEYNLAREHPKTRAFYDRDLKRAIFQGRTWAALAGEIVEALPEQVYVSFDVDGLDPSLCPHTGTPVPGGLDFDQACFLLEAVVESGRRVVGFDLCEAAPNLRDPADEWDLNVCARLLHKLCVLAYRSKKS